MTRDWKPGDVAMVEGQVALVVHEDCDPPSVLTFVYTDDEGDLCSVYVNGQDAQPLLVIDPAGVIA